MLHAGEVLISWESLIQAINKYYNSIYFVDYRNHLDKVSSSFHKRYKELRQSRKPIKLNDLRYYFSLLSDTEKVLRRPVLQTLEQIPHLRIVKRNGIYLQPYIVIPNSTLTPLLNQEALVKFYKQVMKRDKLTGKAISKKTKTS